MTVALPRVLHVTTDLQTRSSGVRTCLLELARAQHALGASVAAHCILPPTPAGDDASDEGALPFPVSASRAILPAPLHLSPAAERWARSPAAARFDVLHQHGIWTALSRATVGWRATHGRPTVIAPHGALTPESLRFSRRKKALALRWYERANLTGASCLQAASEGEVECFRAFGLRNPIAVIPLAAAAPETLAGGDAARFRRAHQVPPGARLLLFLSRIHPQKGLLDAVGALGRLRDALGPWHLMVAGPEEAPAYCAAVRAQVAQHGLTARVHWVGPLHGAAKRDALAAAELFVLPTLGENYALVVAEALSAGVPVLTTRAARPWQVLEARGCGWWVPPGVDGLTDALAGATALPAATLAAMGRRGIAVAREQCQWPDVAARTFALYRWLLGAGERPGHVVTD